MTAADFAWGLVMDRVKVDLKNCYGIKHLKQEFDFSKSRAFAIYAPNGAMKSSFAETFLDIAKGRQSEDRIFPDRETARSVTDKTGKDLEADEVLVVKPYDEELGHTERTSTLLVDAKLRSEYSRLQSEIQKAKDELVEAMKAQASSKKDMEQEFSSAFTRQPDAFYTAAVRIKSEIEQQSDSPLSNVLYDKIFDEKILAALNNKGLKSLIEGYVRRYTELLDASIYFSKDTFNYYNAGEIAKSLASNGFFNAKHSVVLNGDGEKVEIATEAALEKIIAEEKSAIMKDSKLRKSFDDVAKALDKNVALRDFRQYMLDHQELLSRVDNLDKFREDVFKSYIVANRDLYNNLVSKFEAAQQRKKQIEDEARNQRTLWEKVIEEFNNRFFVPFKLEAKNRVAVMLGDKPMIDLGFIYKDGNETVEIGRNDLLKALSTGERRAFYILNVLFEIEARRKAGQETLVVIDDIADSFDYQNKYAIIQYLKDIGDDPLFKQIIMTHNFDFFRTIESRFVKYKHCLMATKSSHGITLQQAVGVRNIFIRDWKENFFVDDKKKIASIPFIRNLVEYCDGEEDDKFKRLTALLHWKPETETITVENLEGIFKEVCGKTAPEPQSNSKPVVQLIEEQASSCLSESTGIDLEKKIVLAIAIRLGAERFMLANIADQSAVESISHNQTQALFREYKKANSSAKELETLDRVLLMTPENIHLNSFMYEPIVDMSDEHLKRLFQEVKAL